MKCHHSLVVYSSSFSISLVITSTLEHDKASRRVEGRWIDFGKASSGRESEMSQAETSPKTAGTKRDVPVDDAEKNGVKPESSNGDKERERAVLMASL